MYSFAGATPRWGSRRRLGLTPNWSGATDRLIWQSGERRILCITQVSMAAPWEPTLPDPTTAHRPVRSSCRASVKWRHGGPTGCLSSF